MNEEVYIEIANLRLTVINTTCVDIRILNVLEVESTAYYFYDILDVMCQKYNVEFATVVVKLTNFCHDDYINII